MNGARRGGGPHGHGAAGAAIALILAAASALPPGLAAAATPMRDDVLQCQPLQKREHLNDYRGRDSTPEKQWAFSDNKTHHFDPAVARMRAGDYSRNVMGDLNWVLVRWPNHYPALRALIEYDLSGGRQYEFMPAECYFANARKFVPDDVNVVQAEAYFFWKKGDKERAKALYEEALVADPDSAETHYNLGLLYFEMSEFTKAKEHAQTAYAAAYPLPGLRRKLEKAGYWKEALATETTEKSP